MEGTGELVIRLPDDYKVLFVTTQERDNRSYGETKVWLAYAYGENSVTIRYADASRGRTNFQCVVFGYKD